jgi:hypothetical protein
MEVSQNIFLFRVSFQLGGAMLSNMRGTEE